MSIIKKEPVFHDNDCTINTAYSMHYWYVDKQIVIELKFLYGKYSLTLVQILRLFSNIVTKDNNISLMNEKIL